jgi:hypothetical protein
MATISGAQQRGAGRPTRSRRLIKIAVGMAVLAGLVFLFLRSVRDSRATPYTVQREHFRNWTLSVEPTTGPSGPMLVLRPPLELTTGLFHQIFSRNMESLNAPSVAAIPLLLQGEFDRAFARRLTPEALIAAARGAGLESAAMEPRCLAYRRTSDPGGTRQLYFVLFDSPTFERFRQQLGALLEDGAGRGADFDPAALSPVLIIGTTETSFTRWLPLRANPKVDCVAPIVKT